MKLKNLLFFCCLSVLFIGCNSKANEEKLVELQAQNDLLVEEGTNLKAQIEELTSTVKKLESENANLQQQIKELSLAKDDLNNSEKYEIHDLHYTLDFEYNGYDTIVYKDPKLEEICYTIQKDDVVEIFNFIYSYETDKNFIKVKVNNSLDGYIEICGNPYYDGNFEMMDILEVDGIETTILKFEKSFIIFGNVSVKEFPSATANNLHKVSGEEFSHHYKSSAITADYKWVKIQINDFTGWIPSDSLDHDKGGPVLDTPEQHVYFDLIGKYFI